MWQQPKYTEPFQAFDSEWFRRNQHVLLRVLNSPVVGRSFRRLLGVENKASFITNIQPHAITWQLQTDQNKFITEFLLDWRYSKRIYTAFKSGWWALHYWDELVADRWLPTLSYGFSTLTFNPTADNTGVSIDGWVLRTVNNPGSWQTDVHDAGSGTGRDWTSALSRLAQNNKSVNTYTIRRTFFHFDTSSLGSTANIGSATLSFYGSSGTLNDDSDSLNIYQSTAASNNALALSDYSQAGTTAFATAIALGSWATSSYNTFTLNASGLANISKTGVSKFALRTVKDVSSTIPGGSNEVFGYFTDDGSGNGRQPKLTVIFSFIVTKDVSSTSATSKTITKDVTSDAVANASVAKEATTTAATSKTVTGDVSSAGAFSITNTSSVSSSSALSKTATIDIPSTVTTSVNRISDVASSADLNAPASSNILTDGTINAVVTSNVTGDASIAMVTQAFVTSDAALDYIPPPYRTMMRVHGISYDYFRL